MKKTKEQKQDEAMLEKCGICGTNQEFNGSHWITRAFKNKTGIVRVQKLHAHCWHNASVYVSLESEPVK